MYKEILRVLDVQGKADCHQGGEGNGFMSWERGEAQELPDVYGGMCFNSSRFCQQAHLFIWKGLDKCCQSKDA